MSTELYLNDVTICSIDCVTPNLSLRAIRKSQKYCRYAKSLLFTDNRIDMDSSCLLVQINKIKSRDDYSHFVLKELHRYIETPFVLIVQWDGYVLDPLAWSDEFRNYDYIGAKWNWHKDGKNVGNGGFSLRSFKLLKAVSSSSYSFIPDHPEDDQICRTYRDRLTNENSIRFAPEEIADQFSYERALPNYPTFGFHGLFNMWRHCEDHEIFEILEELAPQTCKSREYIELMIQYFMLRKFVPLKHMYLKFKRTQTRQDLNLYLFQQTNDQNFSDFFTQLCEQLTKNQHTSQTYPLSE